MKAFGNPLRNRGFLLLALVAASVALTIPFFLHRGPGGTEWRMIRTHDMIQHLAVMSDFDKVLRSGTAYPRWLPDINGGYGIPWMNFYPPGFYYLASLVHAVLRDWFTTLLAISVLAFGTSGLAFYLLARTFYSHVASVAGAALYLTAPYHVLDLYWRGAMPEFAGFVLVPLIIYFAFKTQDTGRPRDIAGLGFFHGLFLMTHLPTAFLLTYALGFFGIACAVRDKNWKKAIRVAFGIAIAFAVSAIYLVPAALELKDVREHFSLIFPYHSSYITLMKSLDTFAEVLNKSFVANVVALAIAIFVLRAARGRHAGSDAPNRAADGERVERETATSLWVVMGIATAFMCTSFSIYVSELLPKIDVASFAWRWLVVASLFTALIVAAAIDFLSRHSRTEPRTEMGRLWFYRSLIAAGIVLNVWVTGGRVIAGALSNPPLATPANYVEPGFTPQGAADPHELPETPQVTIQPESGAFEVVLWQPYDRQIGVSVAEPSRVRLKTYNFPGWTALVDGKPAQMLSDPDGVQMIEVPAGVHMVEASFRNTPIRTIGALMSLLGVLAVIGLVALDRPKYLNPATNDRSQRVPMMSLLNRGGIVLSILVVVAAIGLWILGHRRSREAPAGAGPSQPGKEMRRGPDLTIGSEGVLHVDGADSTIVCNDEAALNQLILALSSRDDSKVKALVESGQARRVANDTHVRIIGAGSGIVKVRILQGEGIMNEGWVPERWVR